MDADQSTALIREMRESFERLETMVADLRPTDEADPAELIAGLKRRAGIAMRGGLRQLERAVDDWAAAAPRGWL